MLASATRLALDVALPRGGATRLSVLAYHRVLEAPDPMRPHDPAAGEFERTMRWVRDTFNVIRLVDAVAGLRTGRLPRRALAITFDDGYADNLTVAAPILARLGLPATFFLATGYLGGGRMFNDTVIEAVRGAASDPLDLVSIGLGCHPLGSDEDRLRAIAAILAAIKYEPVERRTALAEGVAELAGVAPRNDLMLTHGQAAELARRGFDLGAHTLRHPILARLDLDAARREIEDSRRDVEALAGGRVALFAYPNGVPGRDYTAETVRLVRDAGFDGAVSTSPGAARADTDPHQIPRFTPWDTGPVRFVARMWNNAVRVEPRLLPVDRTMATRTQ